MEIRQATRQHVKPLIGVYAESGCGKTMSALLLARGIVGPTGKIVMADSESGRGELYADVIPGGYQVARLEPPFSPSRYIEAHNAIVAAGAAIGVFDSGSHEWEGQGGVLDQAADSEEKSGKAGLHNWKKPKMEHAKFMLCLLQSPIPWIVCLRAKYKSRQVKGTPEMAESGQIRRQDVGKTVIVKDERTSPIQAEDFIYEMTAHLEILPDHSIYLSKCSHPSLRQCFPDKGPITVEHGQKIAAWCAAPGTAPKANSKAAPSSVAMIDNLKRDLWKLTERIHGHSQHALSQFLWDENFMSDTESIHTLTADRLTQIIDKVKAKLEVTA